MRRIPRSLLLALRDLSFVGLLAFSAGILLIGIAVQQDAVLFAEAYGVEVAALGVDPWPVLLATDWALGVLLWAFAIWCATRARAGTRWVWLPVALAALWVAVQSVGAIGPWERARWAFDWPGPAVPIIYADEGAGEFVALHAGWAFPPLVVGLLALAAVLGARVGRLPDDRAARRVTAPPRSGLALTGTVVGLTTLGGVAGAVAVYIVVERTSWLVPGDLVLSLVGDLVLPLAAALAAAALLSGTGPLGALATLLAALPAVGPPLDEWLRASAGDTVLLQALAAAVAVLAVASWRPSAQWAGELLGPAGMPPAASLPG